MPGRHHAVVGVHHHAAGRVLDMRQRIEGQEALPDGAGRAIGRPSAVAVRRIGMRPPMNWGDATLRIGDDQVLRRGGEARRRLPRLGDAARAVQRPQPGGGGIAGGQEGGGERQHPPLRRGAVEIADHRAVARLSAPSRHLLSAEEATDPLLPHPEGPGPSSV